MNGVYQSFTAQPTNVNLKYSVTFTPSTITVIYSFYDSEHGARSIWESRLPARLSSIDGYDSYKRRYYSGH